MDWALGVVGRSPCLDGDCGDPDSRISPSSADRVAAAMTSMNGSSDSRVSSAEDAPELDHWPPIVRASIANVASRIVEYSSLE